MVTALAVIGAVALDVGRATGDSATGSAGTTSTASASTSQPAFIAAGARFDAGGDGWVLGSGSLDVTRNGGKKWTQVPLPTTATSVADVAVLSDEMVSVAGENNAEAVEIARRGNGSSAWDTESVPVGVAVSSGEVVDRRGTLDGVMVTAQTSSNFSQGVWLTSPDGGATWKTHAAPAGGTVTAADDRLWLVGGPLGSSLYSSVDDGSDWAQVTVPTPSGGSQKAWALTPVQTDGNGGIVLTETRNHTTRVMTGTHSSSGWAWQAGPSLDLGGSYGAGTSARASSVADGVLWVLSPVNKLARVDLSSGTVTTVNVNGLPTDGTITIHATSADDAWANYANDTCPRSQIAPCVPTAGIAATTDGGQSWTALTVPSAN